MSNPIKAERQIGNCRLLLGDCIEILPTLEAGSVDAVVTDPPYGLGEKWKGGTWFTRGVYAGAVGWDSEAPQDAIKSLLNIGQEQIIWGGNHFALPPSRGWLVWRKTNAVPTMAACELCWTSQDRPIRQWEGTCNGWVRFHPTEKPVALMEWCLSFVPNAETILDPFAGSGTTGVACIRTGRKFIGIEKEPRYFEIAVKRIQAELAQGDLFREVGA
jgi:DNA modification methylase